MNSFSFNSERLRRISLVAAFFLLCIGAVFAQRPKVTLQDGHISPIMARVTYPDGKTQNVMIISHRWGGTHQYMGTNDSGGDMNIWFDTIATIADPNDDGVTVTLKNGRERHLGWHGGTQDFQVADDDGGNENVDIKNVKKIEFLNAPRKDKQGNAMFPNWRYSPFTGEKLPEE